MADRQKFCTSILCILLLISIGYLSYNIFLNPSHTSIDKYNHLRLYIFFSQHLITLLMLVKMFIYYGQQHDYVIVWMFQLSFVIVMTFIGGEVFIVARGGRMFGSRVINQYDYNNISDSDENIVEFQLNQITLYFQIMTDFVMFFIVSSIAMIVLKCRAVDSEERYEFMIDNLKSEDYVEDGNVTERKSCAICLTDLAEERVLKLPCEHIFHKECLVNWLKRSTICPMCRNDIQESLAPNSPQRYPAVNSQPIILPPPPNIPPQHSSISIPPTQLRRSISINNNRSQNRSQNHNQTNNNQPTTNRYQIFDQPRPIINNQLNQPHRNQRIINDDQVSFVNQENLLNARMRKQVMRENQHGEHQLVNLAEIRRQENVLAVSRAITERKTEVQQKNRHQRHPSSPHLYNHEQITPRQQTPNPNISQPPQIKKKYPNPNQNFQNNKFQHSQILHDVSINEMVREEIA